MQHERGVRDSTDKVWGGGGGWWGGWYMGGVVQTDVLGSWMQTEWATEQRLFIFIDFIPTPHFMPQSVGHAVRGKSVHEEGVGGGAMWHKLCTVCGRMTQSTIGSLKTISQRPVPLPRLKGDVKGLWPLPFMCIDPLWWGAGLPPQSSPPSAVISYSLTCRKWNRFGFIFVCF